MISRFAVPKEGLRIVNKRKGQKISITDVAARAGVSITTVSRVLNKVSSVSPRNQAKVEAAIAHFKYKPDVSAQRLARGTNNAVGLVMPGYPGIFHSYYAIELIRGVGHACETLRMDLVFHIANKHNQLNVNSVGGIIFADIIENRNHVEEALANQIPCVVINNIVEDVQVSYIGIDNIAGAELAMDHLMNLGHTAIGLITGNLQTQAGKQRWEGAERAAHARKLDIPQEYIIEGDYSRRSARLAAEKLLSLPHPPTALFVASDDMALEVISYAIEKGIRVPGDLSVVGFDDNPSALYGPVALTTIRQPLFQMAEIAVKYLHSTIHGAKKDMVKEVLKPELIIRDSCAARQG